jgi:hypothetical protein
VRGWVETQTPVIACALLGICVSMQLRVGPQLSLGKRSRSERKGAHVIEARFLYLWKNDASIRIHSACRPSSS